jgi:ATP-binding cassette subfamily C (CFTR/MRP) protein 1
MTAVYRKSMEVGSVDINGTKIVTLMSTDCEVVVRGLLAMHELWASVVQVGLAVWLIQRELGIACLGPIAITTGRFFDSFDLFNC